MHPFLSQMGASTVNILLDAPFSEARETIVKAM